MKKSDLIRIVKERAALNERAADNVISNIFEQITNAMARGDSVTLIGFGSFHVKARGERTGRHPATGDKLLISAQNVPQFKAGKALKESTNTPL